MSGRSRSASRVTDEAHLAWVRLRCAGLSSREIAAMWEETPSQVRIATTRIMSADLAESGEDASAVSSAYWNRELGGVE